MTAPHLYKAWDMLPIGTDRRMAAVCFIDDHTILIQHDACQFVGLHVVDRNENPELIGGWSKPCVAARQILVRLYQLSSDVIPVPINLLRPHLDVPNGMPVVALGAFGPASQHTIYMKRDIATAIESALGRNPFDNPPAAKDKQQ